MMLDWQIQAENDSMKNTPPCWCIYMLGLVCDWLAEMGGLAGIQKVNEMKAKMLYDVLEQTEIFTCHARPEARSDMNVTFRTASAELDALFVSQAAEAGMSNLKGHRKTGGMRASIYNAMPVEGVEKLCNFIRDFDKANR
jgi:phosphoserine aminotransferase